MSDIGKMIKSKGKEYSIGIREINMKEIGKNINRKEIAFSNIKDTSTGFHLRYVYTGAYVELP